VIVTEIYAAREQNTLGIEGQDLVDSMHHRYARYAATLEDAASAVLERVQSGDVVITLGAGDGYLIGEWVLEALRERNGEGAQPAGGLQPGSRSAPGNGRSGGTHGMLAAQHDGKWEVRL
jgi:hypothetical protein